MPTSSPQTPPYIAQDAEFEKRFELTPRSKLKKLLEASDSEENDEPVVGNGPGNKEDGMTAYERVKRTLLNDIMHNGKVTGQHDQQDEFHDIDSSTAEKPTLNINAQSDEEGGGMLVNNTVHRSLQRKGKLPFDDESSDEEVNFARSSQPGLTRSAGDMTLKEKDSLSSGDDDLPKNLMQNNRFQELVERKRRERLAKEQKEKRKAKERRERQQLDQDLSNSDHDDEEEEDDAILEKNTARPIRKAGKKALEEMHRETQRMARSLQLAHEATTKLKIPKQSLFERFNFRTSNTTKTPREITTTGEAKEKKPQSDKSIPTLKDGDGEAVMSSKVDKGKAKAKTVTPPSKISLGLIPIKLKNPPPSTDDPDSDFEILDPAYELQKQKAAEQKKKQQAILELKKRAGNIGQPKSNLKRNHMSAKELQAELLRQSRLQAINEREERIKELQAKGVVLQTAEERAQDEAAVEDLIEKARLEAEKIKRLEKAEKKQERLRRIVAGEDVTDAEDNNDDHEEENDGEWLDEEQEEFHELSDSEIEPLTKSMDTDNDSNETNDEFSEEEDEEMKEYKTAIRPVNDSSSPVVRLSDMPRPYIDNEADEEKDEEREEECDDGDIDVSSFRTKRSRKTRINRIADEEDEMQFENNSFDIPRMENLFSRNNPLSGFGVPSTPPLGLTQMFEGTMALSVPQRTETDGLDALRKAPSSLLPKSQAPQGFENSQENCVPETQLYNNDIELDLQFNQSQVSESQTQSTDVQESMLKVDLNFTQDFVAYDFRDSLSQFPDPTPDTGFAEAYTPAPPRFAYSGSPMSVGYATQPTQVISLRKKRRLRRVGDSEENSDPESGSVKYSPTQATDAFSIMKKAAKKTRESTTETFDKTKSEAKEMVDEAAIESDDEYAGLGGYSDDGENFDEEAAQEVADIINDRNDEKVDEEHIAAYYAEKERHEDERKISKLFRELNNGGLRRKRGADFELSDSEDEEERRRARKRANEARMRKLILEDEKIAKFVSNPKRDAFLRSVEDREKDDSMMFLDQVESELYLEVSQDPNNGESQSAEGGEGKARENYAEQGNSNDPFTNLDRCKESIHRRVGSTRQKKPKTLESIRNTLSYLIEEESIETSHYTALSDSSEDSSESEAEITITSRPRRTTAKEVIDRVALKRQGNSVLIDEQTKLAFAPASNDPDNSTFKIPSLLRRATTNSTSLSSNSESQGGNGGSSSTSFTGDNSGVVVKKAGPGNNRSVTMNYRRGLNEVQNNRKEMEKKREMQKRKRLMKMKASNREGGKILGLLKGRKEGFE